MPNPLAYMAAGLAQGAGEGLVSKGKALRDQRKAQLEREYRTSEREAGQTFKEDQNDITHSRDLEKETRTRDTAIEDRDEQRKYSEGITAGNRERDDELYDRTRGDLIADRAVLRDEKARETKRLEDRGDRAATATAISKANQENAKNDIARSKLKTREDKNLWDRAVQAKTRIVKDIDDKEVEIIDWQGVRGALHTQGRADLAQSITYVAPDRLDMFAKKTDGKNNAETKAETTKDDIPNPEVKEPVADQYMVQTGLSGAVSRQRSSEKAKNLKTKARLAKHANDPEVILNAAFDDYMFTAGRTTSQKQKQAALKAVIEDHDLDDAALDKLLEMIQNEE